MDKSFRVSLPDGAAFDARVRLGEFNRVGQDVIEDGAYQRRGLRDDPKGWVNVRFKDDVFCFQFVPQNLIV